MAKRKSPGGGIAEEVQPVFEAIAGLVNVFCREHLNEEYADLCRRLTEKLARKRPSPLVSGKPNTWACGIVSEFSSRFSGMAWNSMGTLNASSTVWSRVMAAQSNTAMASANTFRPRFCAM